MQDEQRNAQTLSYSCKTWIEEKNTLMLQDNFAYSFSIPSQ